MEFSFKVIICDSRTKSDIGLYTFCPASEEIFEEQQLLNFLQRGW